MDLQSFYTYKFIHINLYFSFVLFIINIYKNNN